MTLWFWNAIRLIVSLVFLRTFTWNRPTWLADVVSPRYLFKSILWSKITTLVSTETLTAPTMDGRTLKVSLIICYSVSLKLLWKKGMWSRHRQAHKLWIIKLKRPKYESHPCKQCTCCAAGERGCTGPHHPPVHPVHPVREEYQVVRGWGCREGGASRARRHLTSTVRDGGDLGWGSQVRDLDVVV